MKPVSVNGTPRLRPSSHPQNLQKTLLPPTWRNKDGGRMLWNNSTRRSETQLENIPMLPNKYCLILMAHFWSKPCTKAMMMLAKKQSQPQVLSGSRFQDKMLWTPWTLMLSRMVTLMTIHKRATAVDSRDTCPNTVRFK